ncbi:hypothetical protein TNCV_2561621 [Trichonephila clavipes]|uniref:Uncharacterized protein n=1 Tax=Trichonephila clavipes TaxID=2585209 RepID=A0A8X6R9H1_TRICX|nr:hypothetical protein TNCV_2561621 [Trichonephila clavipes]
MASTVYVECLRTVGVKVFEKGSKRYRISMTMYAHTSPLNPKQHLKIRVGKCQDTLHTVWICQPVTSRPSGHLRYPTMFGTVILKSL